MQQFIYVGKKKAKGILHLPGMEEKEKKNINTSNDWSS
jgi:hypothetical protein